METSVVMITFNRRSSAVETVHALRALPERPPIVVVDNGSGDGTPAALGEVGGVTVVRAGRNLGAAGRTVGVAAADTPFVAFADDDSVWAPGALALAEQQLRRHPRLALIAGRTLVGPECRDDPINALLAAAPLGTDSDLPGPTVLGFLACAAIVRREAYLRVGGFNAHYGIGSEEQLLALDLLAAGLGSSYLPDIVTNHHPEPHPNRAGRAARQLRNDLWTAWLRRRPVAALRATAQLARRARGDSAARQALREAAAGLPWVLRERRPLPRTLDRVVTRAERALDEVSGRPGRSVWSPSA